MSVTHKAHSPLKHSPPQTTAASPAVGLSDRGPPRERGNRNILKGPHQPAEGTCPLQKGQAGDTQQWPNAAEDPGIGKTDSSDTGCVSLPETWPCQHPQEGGHPHPQRTAFRAHPRTHPSPCSATAKHQHIPLSEPLAPPSSRAGPAHTAPREEAGQAEGGRSRKSRATRNPGPKPQASGSGHPG